MSSATPPRPRPTPATLPPPSGRPWPVLDRTAVHQTALDQVAAGIPGLILTGESGRGKSTLAERLARLCTDRPIYVRGTDVMADVPYGALHGTLIGEPPEVLASPAAMTRAIQQRLAAAAESSGRAAIVCDNAHLVDTATTHLLAQLAGPGCTVLAVAAALTDVPQPLLEPWRDGRFATYELPPLTQDELAAALTAHLGGPVALTAVHVIGDAGHWNPLYVQYVVAELVETAALQHQDGIWVVTRPGRIRSERVVELLGARIDRWSAGRRRVLEALALTDGLDPHLIEQLTDADDVAALLADGTLEASPGPAPVIRIRQRLVADLVRARITITGRRRWRDEVMAHDLSSVRDTPEGLLALALWTLDCGAPLEADLAVAAARVANDRFDPEVAQRLAIGVRDEAALAAAAIESARAWRAQGHHAQALGALRRARPALAAGVTGRFAVEYARAAIHTGARAEAWEIVAEARTLLDDAPDHTAGAMAENAADLEVAEWELLLAELRLEELVARLAEARARIRERGDPGEGGAPPAVAQRWLLASCYLAGALAVQGRHHDGATVVAEVLAAPVLPTLDLTDGLPVLFLGLLLAGDYATAAAMVPTPNALQPWQGVYVGSAIDTAVGTLHLLRGRAEDALPHLLSGLGQWLVVDNMSALSQAHEVVALCQAELGHRTRAAGHLRAATSGVRAPQHLGLMAEYLRFRARMLVEGPETVLPELTAAAEQHRRSARPTQAMWLLTVAARAGHPSSLHALASDLLPEPGAMAVAIRRWAGAVIAQDPAALVDAAAALAACGHGLLAQEAADLAVGLDPRQARAAAEALAAVSRSPAAVVPSSLDLLTPRERDVVRLASSGLANRDIAAELYLSLRTVESYLSNAFTKLGVSGRKELAQFL